MEASIERLQEAMTQGEVTSEELVLLSLARMALHGKHLNALQAIAPDAVATARARDVERQRTGPRSALHGLPMVVKDNYETAELPTTMGAVAWQGFQPPGRDAHQVTLLRQAGAVLVGKSTMHEFAFGITSVGSAFGHVRNPYDRTRNPGGSSGGTAAAVAANLAVFGMGSDTAGSIRIPASHTCLVGLRGTQGLSSRRGIVPLSHTQDMGGPMARCVRDLAMVLSVTVGYDPGDVQTAESYRKTVDYAANLEQVPNARIGLLVDWTVQEAADEPVARVIRAALDNLTASAGWTVLEIASPNVNANLADRPKNGHHVLIHEFPADFNEYVRNNPALGIKDLNEVIASGRVHPEVPMTAFLKDSDEATYHIELLNRQVLRTELLDLMAANDLDALAYPTIRRVAALIGEDQEGSNAKLSSNTGLPAITVPAGFVSTSASDGTMSQMPVGLELLGESWSEQKLLNLAITAETHSPARRSPPFMRERAPALPPS
jgi:amidase